MLKKGFAKVSMLTLGGWCMNGTDILKEAVETLIMIRVSIVKIKEILLGKRRIATVGDIS